MNNRALSVVTDHAIKLAAEESVIQMMNRPALKSLRAFNSSPDRHHTSFLITIPALHHVLRHEESEFLPGHLYSATILGVCKWLSRRGEAVLGRLIEDSGSSLEINDSIVSSEWQKVCLKVFTGRNLLKGL